MKARGWMDGKEEGQSANPDGTIVTAAALG